MQVFQKTEASARRFDMLMGKSTRIPELIHRNEDLSGFLPAQYHIYEGSGSI